MLSRSNGHIERAVRELTATAAGLFDEYPIACDRSGFVASSTERPGDDQSRT